MKKTALIMAGGKGERFWPRSRVNLPKQFLSLTDDGKTMIQLTVISVKRIIKEIKQKDIDFTEIIPYTIILVNITIFIFSYTLYDGYFFEYRYLIIVYLMQIVICLKAINKLSDEHIFKALITFAISFVLLCCARIHIYLLIP